MAGTTQLGRGAQAAKDVAAKAKAEARRKEQSEKLSRRLARHAAYRAKHPPGYAQRHPLVPGWLRLGPAQPARVRVRERTVKGR